MEGLEGLVLIGSDSLLLAAPEVVGFYVVAPELRFGGNVNEATGKSGEQVVADYEARYKEASTTASFVHAYDATTLLRAGDRGGGGGGWEMRSTSTGRGCGRR